jgi:small-conductance mechanosensitive channel
VSWLGTRVFVACLVWILRLRGWEVPRETLIRRLRPTARFLGVLVLRWGLLVIGASQAVLVVALTILNPLLWLLGTWALFRLLDLIGDLVEAHLTASKRGVEIGQMLWPVGSLALKIALFLVMLFHLMAIFSWDVSTVLAGLGIGGVAFALGAQDSLKNLFGSFTLIADRPFVVGENVTGKQLAAGLSKPSSLALPHSGIIRGDGRTDLPPLPRARGSPFQQSDRLACRSAGKGWATSSRIS